MELSNIFRRAAFALRFGDLNPLISGQVTPQLEAAHGPGHPGPGPEARPVPDFDADPYPVIVNGRITWVLDAYTTSSQYPYSQSFSGAGGLSDNLNYVRNSVKATIDAYDGTVHFYVIDTKDPMVRSYREAFPDLFTDFSKMPAALRDHLRYPKTSSSSQSDVFSTYHVTNTTPSTPAPSGGCSHPTRTRCSAPP